MPYTIICFCKFVSSPVTLRQFSQIGNRREKGRKLTRPSKGLRMNFRVRSVTSAIFAVVMLVVRCDSEVSRLEFSIARVEFRKFVVRALPMWGCGR